MIKLALAWLLCPLALFAQTRTVTSNEALQLPGTFVSGGNQYFGSSVNVNNMDFLSEVDVFCNGCGGQYGLVAGVESPSSGATGNGGFGVFGIGTSQIASSGGNNQFGGGQFLGHCKANGCQVWGIQPNVVDDSGLTTGVSLVGSELDVIPRNPGSAYTSVTGYDAILSGNAHAGQYGNAFLALGNVGTSTSWVNGFATQDQAAVNALSIGASSAVTGASGSQPIVFAWRPSGSTNSISTIAAESSGNLTATVPVGQVFKSTGGFAMTGGSAFVASLSTPTYTANRNYLFPDASGNLCVTGSGKVPCQSQRTAGCQTGTAQFSTCAKTVTWTTAFADASYTATCSGDVVSSGVPILQGITAKTATSVTVQTIALTAAAAQFATIDCHAEHD